MIKTEMMTRLPGQMGYVIHYPNLPKPLCSLSPSVLMFAVANKAGSQGHTFRSDTRL